MKLIKISTTTSALPAAGVSVLLFLLSILHLPVQTNGNVLSNKVVPICESGCHCYGSEGNCPSYPTITENMLPTFRALTHVNPKDLQCDPFESSACVSTIEEGEACVVDLIAPNATSESSCPSGYSYRLQSVPSLDTAIADGQYITHTGACGTCSSLQDLALMIEYPNIPYKAQQCFFRSTALKYIDEAITCYEEVGFTLSCSTTLAYHQRSIVQKECGYQCAAWAYDGDLGNPSCQDVSGCGACVDELGISARLELVAGRTFANSGYPSQKAQQCSDIAPVDVIGGSDVCSEASLSQSPTEVPLAPTVPITASPTVAPVPLATAVPTGTPTVSPIEATRPPTDVVTAAPVEATAEPVSTITGVPTPAPVPLTTPLSYQECLSMVAIEVRVGAMSEGNGVYCDCSEAQTGATNRPKCFSNPDRNDSSECAIMFDSCGPEKACCGDGVRSCRGGLCRNSGRTADRSNFRLSGSRGGGAARNDRSRTNRSNVNGDDERLHRDRIRGRA